MARQLHATLHERVLSLGDDVMLLPGHDPSGRQRDARRAATGGRPRSRARAADRRRRRVRRGAARRDAAAPGQLRERHRRQLRAPSLRPRAGDGRQQLLDPLTETDDAAPPPDPDGPRRDHRRAPPRHRRPNRIRILDLLRDGELLGRQITERLGTSQQNASKHLGVLLQAGIVARRKEGTSSLYCVADHGVYELCEQVCGGLQPQLCRARRHPGRSAGPMSSTAPRPPARPRRTARPLMHAAPDRSAASAATPPPTSAPSSIAWAARRRRRSAFFAPRVETALSGAGWEATGSESVAGPRADRHATSAASSASAPDGRRPLAGARPSPTRPSSATIAAASSARCSADPRVDAVVAAAAGRVDLRATATPRSCRPARRADANEMVARRRRPQGAAAPLSAATASRSS